MYRIKSEVWLYKGASAWHFVSIPKKESEEIRQQFKSKKKGWGSIPVEVTIGKTKWCTSIFPDKRANCFILPLKASIRKSEHIQSGDLIQFCLKII